MRSIAIIESERGLSSTISAELRAEGLQPVRLEPEEGERAVRDRSFALVLLDLLAVSDPLGFCRSVVDRQPVIAMAMNEDPSACVEVLEAGADDCVPRSINSRELMARVRNVLRRAASRNIHAQDSGAIAAMRVRVGDEVRNLSRGEAEVLSVLLEHAPAPLTVDQILALLSASSKARRGTIASRLKSLRRKLGPGWIEVRAGFGYQIVRAAGPEED